MKTRNCGSGEMLADYYKARNGQIASTLKVLSQSGRDKNVQVRGLRFLLDSCKEGLDCEFR